MRTTLQLPAMVNAHSHAFQRGLRGRTELPSASAAGDDDFWTWRDAMFALADSLDPLEMRTVAAAVYGEMRAAGYGVVGEFHYVHHQPDGSPYEDDNAMSRALVDAARDAGLRLVLIPVAYHRNGWDGGDRPPAGGQRRFCDPDVDTFLDRVERLRSWADGQPHLTIGVGAHSLRAVPHRWLPELASYAEAYALPLHVHVAEQPRELEEVRAEHGCSPLELLDRSGFLGDRTSLVHAIHVTDDDVARIAASGATVVTCPTTEGNLGDGYFPALRYRDHGVPIAIGTDSQCRIDPFEELRELETGARRERRTRNALLAHHDGDLWTAVRANGCGSLGVSPDVTSTGSVTIDAEHRQLGGVAPALLPAALVAGATAEVVAASSDLRATP